MGRPPGFTLVELLAATAVLAVVLSMIYAGCGGTVRMARETEAQCDLYAMAVTAMERVLQDLETAWHPAGRDDAPGTPSGPAPFRGERREIRGMPAGTLRFRTLSHLDFTPHGDRAPAGDVHYEVVEDEQGEGLVLVRADSPVYGAGSSPAAPAWPLCRGLSGVRFTFWDGDGGASDSWDTEEDVPVMVTVELEFINPSAPASPYRFRSTAVLRSAANVYGTVVESR